MTAAATETQVTTGGGRPQQYRTKNGTKVPGVTTVCGRFKEAGGLIHWAWQLGVDGQDYRRARDDAGGIGHYAHALVDANVHRRDAPEPPRDLSAADVERARTAFAAFLAWREQMKVTILDTESPHVSELWRFGGTWDAIARREDTGEVFLLDWKSSNAVYREYIAQVSAYRTLAREQGYGVRGAGLLRFGKAHGDFTYHHWPESVLDLGWDAFTRMLELFEIDRKLKEVIR
jgi:hypothetical protein